MEIEEIQTRFNTLSRDGKYSLQTSSDTKTNEKITVNCTEHGLFHVRLSNFLRGSGCPICSGKIRKSTEGFIEEAKRRHGDIYGYEKTIYRNAKSKVIITCPQHGDFEQTPTNHLSGNGCPKCKTEKLKKLFSSNTDEFIKKAQTIHGLKYDYTHVDYVNNSTNVEVICPLHGKYLITPNNHLKGEGCPICRESTLEREVRDILTSLQIDFISQWHLPWSKYMSLDFYIPNYNLGIECQGIQHFEDNHFFEPLHIIQERDEKKFSLCAEHGIKILYYTHCDVNDCIIHREELISEINKRDVHPSSH